MKSIENIKTVKKMDGKNLTRLSAQGYEFSKKEGRNSTAQEYKCLRWHCGFISKNYFKKRLEDIQNEIKK